MKPDTTLPKHIVRIERTCTACPSQWDAWTDDDCYVYIRYRGGAFRIDLSDNEESFMDYTSGRAVTIYAEDFGDDLDGYIDDDEMMAHAEGILTFSESAKESLTCHGPLEFDYDHVASLIEQFGVKPDVE